MQLPCYRKQVVIIIALVKFNLKFVLKMLTYNYKCNLYFKQNSSERY
jgi:hypothetical protein